MLLNDKPTSNQNAKAQVSLIANGSTNTKPLERRRVKSIGRQSDFASNSSWRSGSILTIKSFLASIR